MENKIEKKESFNSLIISLRNAVKENDEEKVRKITDDFKAKSIYYDSVTIESLNSQLNIIKVARNTSTNLTEDQINYFSYELKNLKEQIKEKKNFDKNKELVKEICDGKYDNLVETHVERTYKRRRMNTVVAVAGLAGAILLSLGVKGCVDNNKNNSKTSETTLTTSSMEETYEIDSTVSTSDYYENTPSIYENEYNIDPLIGETTRRNGSYSGSNNGGSTSAESTNSTGTSNVTNTTNGPTPSVVIPGVADSEVVISTDPDGHIESITWPTTETTIPNPVIPDTTPTGTDPLPIEPTVIVLPTPTNTPAPTSTPEPTPTNAPTPAIPTGTIPGETPDVTPTPIPVPTNVPVPATPTPIPEPDPTSSTLPPIPTGDVEGEEDIEYNKTFTGNKPAYIEEIRNIPDPINYVETRNIPGETTIEHTYLEEPGLTEEIRNIPDPINYVETRNIPGETTIEHTYSEEPGLTEEIRNIPGETVTEHDYFAGKARILKR